MPDLAHAVRDRAVRMLAGATRATHQPAGEAVLIMQPDHLGDILLSQPAVRAIRSQFQDSPVIGAVGPWSEHVARRAWDVDDIVTFPFPAFDRQQASRSPLTPYAALAGASRALSHTQPCKVFVLRPDDWWSAWVASMVTDGNIITARDHRMDPFATRQVDLNGIRHASARALAIATFTHDKAVNTDVALRFPADGNAARHVRGMLDKMGVAEDYLVIHPGAGADVKTWALPAWRALAHKLTEAGWQIVVTGSPAEAPVAMSLADGISGVTSIAGRTDLDELAEVLRNASVVIGPDSGPLHLAVACSAPTVHLFGPSDPERYGPWGPENRHRIVTAGWSCSRCGDLSQQRSSGCGCMLAVSPDDVFAVAEELIQTHAT